MVDTLARLIFLAGPLISLSCNEEKNWRTVQARSAVRFGQILSGFGWPLSDFVHLAAADASRAHANPPDPAAHQSAHLLQVRLPPPLGLVVGVAYVVANRVMLSANRTLLHGPVTVQFEVS